MVLTQLPHLGGGQCYMQRSCVESPWCPPGTSPSPWPPQTKVPPSPLLGPHAPHSFLTFLLPVLITTAWEPLLTDDSVPKPASPLHYQPRPELVAPCQGSWVFCSEGVRLFTCLLPWLSRISLRLSHTHSWKKPGAE